MWNPLHFAVYYQNLDLVKFLIKDLKINIGLTAPQADAESEQDAVNINKFHEDKIMPLLLAFDRKDPNMLRFLLDECFRFWSKKTVNHLLEERIGEEILRFSSGISGQQSAP